jgi:hypothetical protein
VFNRNEIRDTNLKPQGPRQFYHHEDLEEYSGGAGMWRTVTGTSVTTYADAAAKLMANPTSFQIAMRRALREWPNSCNAAFTTQGMNWRAWIGHAGCFLATGSPEECTRLGWHQLDEAEQYAANDAADKVIAEWRKAAIDAHNVQLDLFGEWTHPDA